MKALDLSTTASTGSVATNGGTTSPNGSAIGTTAAAGAGAGDQPLAQGGGSQIGGVSSPHSRAGGADAPESGRKKKDKDKLGENEKEVNIKGTWFFVSRPLRQPALTVARSRAYPHGRQGGV